MKLVKKFSLGVILKLAAAVLAIVAFCMMFTDQVSVSNSLGSGTISFSDAVKDVGGIVVGYVLAIVGAIAFAVAGLFEFNNKKIGLVVVCAAALLALVGAILIFCVGGMYKNFLDSQGSIGGYTLSSGSTFAPAAGPVVGGILAIVAAVAGVAGQFLGAKK